MDALLLTILSLSALQASNAFFWQPLPQCECEAFDQCVADKRSQMKNCVQQCGEADSKIVDCFAQLQDAIASIADQAHSCLESANASRGCSETNSTEPGPMPPMPPAPNGFPGPRGPRRPPGRHPGRKPSHGGQRRHHRGHGKFFVYPPDDNITSVLACLHHCKRNVTHAPMDFGSFEFPDLEDSEEGSGSPESSESFGSSESGEGFGGFPDRRPSKGGNNGQPPRGRPGGRPGNNRRPGPKQAGPRGVWFGGPHPGFPGEIQFPGFPQYPFPEWPPMGGFFGGHHHGKPLMTACKHELHCTLEHNFFNPNPGAQDCKLQAKAAKLKAKLDLCQCLSDQGVLCNI